MSDPFWLITSQADGLQLSKDGRDVLLNWMFVARVARLKGPPAGEASLALDGDDSVRVTIDAHGVGLKVRGHPRQIRLTFEMLRTALEKHDEAA